MATLLQLKADVEDKKGTRMKMIFSGASEAHLLAEEIGVCIKQSYKMELFLNYTLPL